jgi:Family of unknown function (DUF716)
VCCFSDRPSDAMDMPTAGASHAGHDHSAHDRHGSLGGHVLPGAFFMLWSLWWFVNMSSIYIHRAQRKKNYKSRPHYRLSAFPSVPFEPLVKIVLCLVGILGELYFSHHAQWRCESSLRVQPRMLGGSRPCMLRTAACRSPVSLPFAAHGHVHAAASSRVLHQQMCDQIGQLRPARTHGPDLGVTCTARVDVCRAERFSWPQRALPCRTLYHDNGTFWTNHLNNWQHTAMFSAFIVSGVVDLVGHRMQLPPATENVRAQQRTSLAVRMSALHVDALCLTVPCATCHGYAASVCWLDIHQLVVSRLDSEADALHRNLQAFLGLAFVIEGLLLAFHLKGNPLEVRVHYLLVLLVAACAAAVFLEAAFPQSALLSYARCFFVLLQGSWFCQAGRILFLDNPAWAYSNDDMGAVMFLPVVFVTHLMVASLALLGIYLVIAYKMSTRESGQRRLEAIERANDVPPAKVALLDLSSKADRAALMHHPLHTR